MNTNSNNFNEEPKLPFNKNGNSSFGLPENYFESFEHKLFSKIELEAELSEFKTLSTISKINNFNTPEAYFNTLIETLDFKAELTEFTNLKSLKSKINFPVNEAYNFEFEKKICHKIELTDELNQFSILNNLNKVSVFITPPNYFEDVIETIKVKCHKTQPSIFDTIYEFLFSKKKAFSFSILVIIFSIWILYPKKSIENSISGDCKTLACLEKQEILNNTKTISNFDEEQIIELVNIKSLNNQLTNDKKKSKNDSIVSDSDIDDIIDEL